MGRDIQGLQRSITTGVRNLIDATEFSNWLIGERANEGDLIVVNNSFIYRKPVIKTSKNKRYLCVKVRGGKPDVGNLLTTEPGEMNADFKLLSGKSRTLPALEPLDKALQREVQRIGRLVFVLIGELEEAPANVDVDHRYVKSLRFDPSAANDAAVEVANGLKTIVVNQLTNPENAWNVAKARLVQEIGDDLASLEGPFARAFEQLQYGARLVLRLPEPTAPKTKTSFIARLRGSVAEQRRLYRAALGKSAGANPANSVHFREVMRIAYNFADDAINILQLLVSVADLKGVLLWSTIKEHLDIAEAFRNLPWTRSDKKPSLERYRDIVSAARNRVFHSLLAFDRTIEADLAGVRVNARRLTLLPAYGRRKSTVSFDYEDREMVEILSELTRAPEASVAMDFWKKNATVMESFERLLKATEDSLWMLNGVRA